MKRVLVSLFVLALLPAYASASDRHRPGYDTRHRYDHREHSRYDSRHYDRGRSSTSVSLSYRSGYHAPPRYYHPAPIVVHPPVYVAPRPIYVPPPVYVAPPVVYPGPIYADPYCAPPVYPRTYIGTSYYYGSSYYAPRSSYGFSFHYSR
jgi:hypothetical protein